MIIEVYIKGRFKANYSGESAGGNPVLSRNYQHIIFKDKWLFDAEEIQPYDKRLLTKEPYYVHPQQLFQDIHINWKSGEKDVFFQEDLENVVMNEIVITRPANEKNDGEFIANFYGTLKVVKPDPPKFEIKVDKSVDTSLIKGFKKEPVIIGDEIIDEDDIYKRAWEPDDFLSNYGISRSSWDSWKLRWKNNGLNLVIYIIGMILMINMGWLSIPLLWIPFIFLAKKTGDTLLGIAAPNFVKNQQLASNNLVGKGRKFFRGLYLLLLLVMLFFFLSKKLFLFAAIAGVLALLHLFTYKSPLLYFVRRIFQLGALLLLLFAALRLFNSVQDTRPSPVVKDDDDTELIPDKPDSSKQKNQYTISWDDYKNNHYKGSYAISKNNFAISFNNRISQTPQHAIEEVYGGVFNVDKNILNGIESMFEKIKKEKNLDAKSFAEMAACFVQRIPYVLVHELSCEELVRRNYNDEFIQDYHREGKQCLQNCKFGLQTPVEFSYNLKGDCDTRALMLFTILDHFGYDVAVFTSQAYGHAIMGIGLPYQGLYKSCNGVRYYTWELTAKDWQPGLLPPQVSNMNNWNVVLINK